MHCASAAGRLCGKLCCVHFVLLGHATYMSADLYFTTDSFFLSSSFFFFRRLISELAERNSTKIGHVLGSKCSLKTHVQVQYLGYPLPLQSGGPKTTFGPTSQINDNFNGLYLRMEQDIDNRSSALTTTRGLLQHPKTS